MLKSMLVLVLTGLAYYVCTSPTESNRHQTIDVKKGPYGPYILVYYVHLLL